jgi:cell division protein FtsZ
VVETGYDAQRGAGFEGEAASFAHAEPAAPGAETPQHDLGSGQQLVPVAASVFDDEFFRRSFAGSQPGHEEPSAEMASAGRTAPVLARIMDHHHPPAEAVESYTPDSDEVPRETRMFAGAAASHASHPETDELDIPAFLRRSR